MWMIMESGACTPAASWLHGGMLRSIATAIAAIVLMSLPAGCTDGPESTPFTLTVAVNEDGDPARAWVADAAAPARPGWSDDWSPWVAAARATPLSALTILLTVRGQSVVVERIRVKLVARRPAIAGTQYVVVGGDQVPHERIEFDLDKSMETLPVKAADGDTIAVTVQTQQCDCDFAFELDWQGGTRTVDNTGKPFRVSASTATVGRCVTYPDQFEKCETF